MATSWVPCWSGAPGPTEGPCDWRQAYGKVDDNGRRWLLGDHVGRLSMVALEAGPNGVASLRYEALGVTSPAETLSYLDNKIM